MFMRVLAATAVVVAAIFMQVGPAAAATCSTVSAGGERRSDLNGDGWDDLVIGAPLEDVGDVVDAGAVHVIYGSRTGWTQNDRLITQNTGGVPGVSQTGDRFGAATATGDFDGDGYCDLAVGSPYEDEGDATDAGRVVILFGSADGITTRGAQSFSQDTGALSTRAEAGDRFGFVLAAQNFGRTAADDLAIGAPGEDRRSTVDAGLVHVVYGTRDGLTTRGQTTLHQDVTGIKDDIAAGEQFGSVLAAGNLGGSSHADLVIGIPGEQVGSAADGGAVHVVFGGRDGLTTADQFWTQDTEGIKSSAEAGGSFGFSLAVGQFGNGASLDLAIGAPGATVDGAEDAGAVSILYGSSGGPTANDELWTQERVPAFGDSSAHDLFGYRLAAGNLGETHHADLAIGVPLEDAQGQDGGAVNVLFGNSDGFRTDTASAIDLDFNDEADLTGRKFSSGGLLIRKIGAPYPEFRDQSALIVGTLGAICGNDLAEDAGELYVNYDAGSGGDAAALVAQDSHGIQGGCEEGDQWGWVGSNHLVEPFSV